MYGHPGQPSRPFDRGTYAVAFLLNLRWLDLSLCHWAVARGIPLPQVRSKQLDSTAEGKDLEERAHLSAEVLRNSGWEQPNEWKAPPKHWTPSHQVICNTGASKHTGRRREAKRNPTFPKNPLLYDTHVDAPDGHPSRRSRWHR